MTTFVQFCAGAKMRHDYSDMLQVRYPHPTGENFDTWVSGEEVLSRLKTMSRAELIRSFGRMEWREAKAALQREADEGKRQAKRRLRGRLADSFSDTLGGHIFGETIADKIRGGAGNDRAAEKMFWQEKIRHDAFRAVALELAWINLEGTFPPENAPEPDDWF
jgi:hypothetical protein